MRRFLKSAMCVVVLTVCVSVTSDVHANPEFAIPHIQPVSKNLIEGNVSSSVLENILKAGPHALIRSFLVEPAYADKRFLGFKLIQRTAHPAIGQDALIKVGDIIVAANGVRLETPAQFMSAWRKLREDKVFVVDIVRAQQNIRYRWKLVQ